MANVVRCLEALKGCLAVVHRRRFLALSLVRVFGMGLIWT